MNGMLQIDPENCISAHKLSEVLSKRGDKIYLSQPASGRDINQVYSRPWISKPANSARVLDSGTTRDRGMTSALTDHSILTNGASFTTARGSSEKQRKAAHLGGDSTAYYAHSASATPSDSMSGIIRRVPFRRFQIFRKSSKVIQLELLSTVPLLT